MAYDISSVKYNQMDGKNFEYIAVINGTEKNIPFDPDNNYYQAIQAEIDAGNITVQPADPEPS